MTEQMRVVRHTDGLYRPMKEMRKKKNKYRLALINNGYIFDSLAYWR